MKNLILPLLFPCFLFGQSTFNVQTSFGFPYAILTSVAVTDSCYFTTGIITDTSENQYKIGLIFAKFDLNGNLLFTKTLLSPSKFYQNWYGDLLKLPDGSLLDIGQVSQDTTKGIIIKYAINGDTISTKEFNSPNADDIIFLPSEIVRYENGNFVIVNIVDLVGNNNQINLMFFDNEFNLTNQKLFGNQYAEIPRSLLIDENDNGLIIGASRSNINIALKNFTSRTYIVKTDSTGTIQWEYLSPPGQLQDIAHSMVKTLDGGIVVASGKGIEHPVNIEVGQLRWQSYIFKLNSNHQVEWGKELRGTRYTADTKLVKILTAHNDSGYLAYGNTAENQSNGIEQYGSWIVKISNEGDSLWARYYTFFDGHDRRPEPYDFKPTPDGGYIVSGQTNEGQEDFGWLMKLDSFGCLIPGCQANDTVSVTATAPEQAKVELAIYPNPTTDYLNFQLRTPQPLARARFRILDAAGRTVKDFSSDSPKDTYIVPVWDWAPGVYFLQYVEEGVVRASERFIISSP